MKEPETDGIMKPSLFTQFSTAAMLEINIIVDPQVPMLVSHSSVHTI